MRHAVPFALVLGMAAYGCASGGEANGPYGTGGDDGGDAAVAVDGGASSDAPHDGGRAADAAGTDAPFGGDVATGGDGASGDDVATGGDGATGDDVATGDDGSASDATNAGDDASDGAAAGGGDSGAGDGNTPSTNIALGGTGYTWQSMTAASANTGRMAVPAVNDGSLSTQANIDSGSGDKANAWEGAGVAWSSAHTVTSVAFVQGTVAGSDGWFEANIRLQFSTDGSTWTDSGWSVTPSYSYTNAVSGMTYTFRGAQVSGMAGARVVGQVNTVGNSWWVAVKEVEIFGY